MGHQGGAYLSNFTRYLDDRLTVIVLTNLDSYDRSLAEGVADLYLPGEGCDG